MVSILIKLSNWIDIHRKRKLKTKQPIKIRINNWVMRNFGFLLLLIIFLMLILFMIFSFQIVGASLESGNYYNHLGDVI
jgi:choline-glycine betaine transporter